MAELDQIWAEMLAHASSKAIDDSRHDIAEYLRLKIANDTIRRAGVDWLLRTMIEAASEAARHRTDIIIERIDPHSFKVGASNMVGSLLQVRQGVRCISLEAGWVRTPSDGIMTKGALAHARITHFGMPRENADLRLVKADPLPIWITDTGNELRTEAIDRHIKVFLGS